MVKEVGISKGTLWYWLLKFGTNVWRVVVALGEDFSFLSKSHGVCYLSFA
jgi:hypothetical protein